MKNVVYSILIICSLCNFQSENINEILGRINSQFKNVEVSIINWPSDLQQSLGNLKKSAFLATPRNAINIKLPLLITLHGGGGKSWSLAEQLERSAKVKGLALAELVGRNMILLEPNSSNDWDPSTLEIMLDYVLEKYPMIDVNRVYVMGHSMGGRGTWNWIMNSPERFAAAAPTGFSDVKDDDDFNRLAKLPIWGMVGGADQKNVGPIKKMVDRLREAGNSNVRHTVFPNANHSKGNASVFSSVKLIDWMLNFSTK